MMPTWFLVALLYADGQTTKQIALQFGKSQDWVKSKLARAKGQLLGVTHIKTNGNKVGSGSKLELRAALMEAGWLS